MGRSSLALAATTAQAGLVGSILLVGALEGEGLGVETGATLTVLMGTGLALTVFLSAAGCSSDMVVLCTLYSAKKFEEGNTRLSD